MSIENAEGHGARLAKSFGWLVRLGIARATMSLGTAQVVQASYGPPLETMRDVVSYARKAGKYAPEATIKTLASVSKACDNIPRHSPYSNFHQTIDEPVEEIQRVAEGIRTELRDANPLGPSAFRPTQTLG